MYLKKQTVLILFHPASAYPWLEAGCEVAGGASRTASVNGSDELKSTVTEGHRFHLVCKALLGLMCPLGAWQGAEMVGHRGLVFGRMWKGIRYSHPCLAVLP